MCPRVPVTVANTLRKAKAMVEDSADCRIQSSAAEPQPQSLSSIGWRRGLGRGAILIQFVAGGGRSRNILPNRTRRPYVWKRLETFAPWHRVERTRRWVAAFDRCPGAGTRRTGQKRRARPIQPKDRQARVGGDLSECFANCSRHRTHPGTATCFVQ